MHFTPGARTAWHTHPHGQTIFVTEGVGRCQREGGPIEVIRPGDRVFFEPGENHWHGAAPNRFMVHIAIQQVDDDGNPRRPGASTSPTRSTALPLLDADGGHGLREALLGGADGFRALAGETLAIEAVPPARV